jgi:hypothetical protein
MEDGGRSESAAGIGSSRQNEYHPIRAPTSKPRFDGRGRIQRFEQVLEFMLTSDASLAEAVGFDPDED